MLNRFIFRGNKGFTLIELLIVIAIIGLLAGIAIPMFLGQRTKAMRTEGETNIRIIFTANENYYAENGVYSPTVVDQDRTYGATTNPLEQELRSVKFGKDGDLYFTYTLRSCNGGQSFLVKATGKSGTPVEGVVFSINEKSELGDGTVACGS